MRNFRFGSISFFTIIKDLIKNLWIFVLGFLIAFLLSYVYVNNKTIEQYQSSASIVANSRDLDATIYTNGTASIEIAKAFEKMIGSENFRLSVVADQGITDENFKLDGHVSLKHLEGTNLITITAQYGDAEYSIKAIRGILNIADNEFKNYSQSNAMLESVGDITFKVSSSSLNLVSTFAKFSILITFLLGVAIVAISYLKGTVKNTYDIIDGVDSDVFSIIPHEENAKGADGLITNPDLSIRYFEAMKKTSAKIQNISDKNGDKIFLVSSSGKGEGKSVIIANIAIDLSKKGKRVLLIDANLREPKQAELFKNSSNDDLMGYLEGKNSLDSIIKTDKETNVDLILCTSPSSNSSDLIISDKMKEIFNSYRDKYDCILVDSPAFSEYSDAEILVSYVDATLFVVAQDKAYVNEIKECIEVIESLSSNFVGCIFNNVQSFNTMKNGGKAHE